ncbi:hypothetical protein IAU59_006218 [Kwoniella sp. CBS 9459]
MSAIIITTTAPYSRSRPRIPDYYSQSTSSTSANNGEGNGLANERTALLRSSSPTPSCTSSVSTYSSSSTAGQDDTESGRNPNRGKSRSSPADQKPYRSPPLKDSISTFRFVIVCTGIWSANFVFAFQSTSIPTLAPEIGAYFQHAELSTYLGSMFTLSSTAVIPLFGVLMETLGRKFAMVTACGFFGLGTVFCALSEGMYQLIAARIFAGLGGGGLLTVSSVIVTDLVPLRDRGYYQGLMMTVFGSGSMLGGPIAGWLTDKYGWHWSFWVQLPVVIFCAIIVSLFLPTAPIPPTHKSLLSGLASLDWLGSFFLITSTTSLILGLSFHTSYLEPWSSPIVWGLILCSIITAVAFFYTETKVERPVVPLKLFKSSHIAAIMIAGFFLSICNQAFIAANHESPYHGRLQLQMFQIPVYFAVIMNTSAAQAGLIMSLCGGLGLATGSMVAGQYIRSGHSWRWLGPISLVPPIIGGVVAALWTPAWPWWSYYATVLPCVLGYSTFLCVQLVALISSIDSQIMPKATALMYTVRSLGATLGVSVGGSVQLGALASSLKKQLAGAENSNEIISAILHSKAAIRLLPPSLRIKALYSYAYSLSVVWTFSAIIAIITFVCSFWIQSPDVHERGHSHSSDFKSTATGDAAAARRRSRRQKRRIQETGVGVVDEPFGEGLGEASIQGETADQGR